MSKDKKGENKVMVHVKIVEATNIAAGDVVARTSDPFVKLRVKGHRHKYQTRVIKDTLNPVWNEDFTFIVNPGLTDVMVLKLKDKDPFSDDFLGLATVPFSLLRDHNGVYSGWFDFTNAKGTKRQRGSVFVKLVLDEDRTQLKNKVDRDLFPIHRKSLLHEKTVNLDARAPQPKPVKFFIGTWNVGNKPPPEDLSAWVPAKGFDLYAIGAQECEYKPRKGFSNCHHDWVAAWQTHLGGDFQLVGNHHLWQMRLVIFAHRTIVPFVSDVQVHTEATGIGSVMGNKGGVCVAMNLRDTRICFMNAHLAAHQHKVKKRNEDVSEIIKGVQVGFPGMDVLHQFHHIFWMGDLNYRLNIGDQEEKTPTKEVWESIVDQIRHNKFAELFAQDQLANEMKEHSVFINFNEGVYNFPPTFKVLREKDLEYNEERSPAWCDRVLWRSVPGFKVAQRALGCSTQITTSDHKPVFATFDVDTYRLLPAIDDLLGDCSIYIKSLKATDLPKADLDGSADPYVKFVAPFLKQSTVRTSWKANNRNPVWDASEVPLLELSVNRKERLKRHFIMIAVYDHDQTKDDIMCNGILPLNAFVDQPEVEVPFKVELFAGGLPAGVLEGSLQFHWEKNDFKPQILPPNVKANEAAPAKK